MRRTRGDYAQLRLKRLTEETLCGRMQVERQLRVFCSRSESGEARCGSDRAPSRVWGSRRSSRISIFRSPADGPGGGRASFLEPRLPFANSPSGE